MCAQQKIKDEVDSLNKISENNSYKMGSHFKTGIKCLVIGLGFYDVSHSTDGKHGDAHVNKTAWEIHPVKEIIFE